jgi:hypothetical protein
MTRLGFIADLHIANHRGNGGEWASGINERGRHTIDAFGNALTLAESTDCARLIVLGDVFDTTKPEPQLIAGAQAMMNQHPSVIKRIIKGNHDESSNAPGDHSLGPLHETAGCEVYEVPTQEFYVGVASTIGQQWGVNVIYVPYQTGVAKEWLPVELGKLTIDPKMVNILCLHLGIHDQSVRDEFFWADKATDAISAADLALLCHAYNIRAVFAGNWHGRKVMEFAFDPHPVHGHTQATLVQVGTLCPTGWDNPGLDDYGAVAFAEIDDNTGVFTLSFAEVPGPRFVNVKSVEELQAVLAAARGGDLYVRWTAKPAEVAHAREELEDLANLKQVKGWDIRIDKEEIQVMARQAAEAAKSTTTLAGVLDAFVSKMPIPDGVDRSSVFQRAKDYLA